VPPQPCVYPNNFTTFVPPSPFPSTSSGVLLRKQVQLIAATDTLCPPCIAFRGVTATYLTYECLCLLGDELPGPHEGPRKGQQLRGHRARHTRSKFHTTHSPSTLPCCLTIYVRHEKRPGSCLFRRQSAIDVPSWPCCCRACARGQVAYPPAGGC
jgi:hypothetical protein